MRQGAENLNDEALLKYYAAEWDRYTSGANFVHRLFTYLNRHWVRREKEEGKKNVYTVYTVRVILCWSADTSHLCLPLSSQLSLVQWKEHMFKHVKAKHRLGNAILKQVEKQRNGEVIETSLVKKVIDSLGENIAIPFY